MSTHNTHQLQNKDAERSGSVSWIIAGVGLLVYGVIGLLLDGVPGVEQLVHFLSSLSGWWILAAAFLAMFLEGLYLIGSFFPGTSIVILLAVLSGGINVALFAGLVVTIFVAWVLAGIVNIVLANYIVRGEVSDQTVEDRYLETWFPAFRANHEVAQIVGGIPWHVVLVSSIKVKLFGCLVFIFYGTIVPLFIDITEASNEEGFRSLFYMALIMIGVGLYQR